LKPIVQVADKRQAVFAATLQAFGGGKAVDLALDVEQGIDPFDGLQCHRRDRHGTATAFGIRGNVSEHEELAA
jgi:queuine/archaeosine tRNA-ribosyltransferase